MDSARELAATLLPTVGASRRLDCDGFWVNARDAVDTRVINSYYVGTGSIIRSEAKVGGFPVIAGGKACTDTDHDGMPNGWEIARGLDPTNDADRNADRDGDGYTNLEVNRAGFAGGSKP